MSEPVVIAIMSGLGLLITALCGAVAKLWVDIRKQRIENQRADDESRKNAIALRREEQAINEGSTNDVLKHFRMIMKQRTEFFEQDRKDARARHDADMAEIRAKVADLEAEIKVLREENIHCREDSIRQKEHSKYQDDEIQRLRTELTALQNESGGNNPDMD